MQLSEPAAKTIDDEGVLSSDEEEERLEEEKEKFTITITLDQIAGSVKNILVAAEGNAKALTKIVFDGKLLEVGKANVLYKEKNTDVLKVFYVQERELLIFHAESLRGAFATPIVDQLFAKLA